VSRTRAALALSLVLASAGCAWSNRDNRPVWNAFEEHLVPKDDAAFLVSLPLTVPGGVLAILADTFVVHPAQVADDALGDARDVWKHIKWRERYYTELVAIPLRTVATPLVFSGSFIGRSFFDIPPRGARVDQEQQERAENHRKVKEWLDALAADANPERGVSGTRGMDWSAELQKSFAAAHARANSQQRLTLYRAAHLNAWKPATDDPALGLLDPDPVVRYEVLEWVSRERNTVPEEVLDRLRDDPNEMVRLRARERFPSEH